jgi:hypothetical protein
MAKKGVAKVARQTTKSHATPVATRTDLPTVYLQ